MRYVYYGITASGKRLHLGNDVIDQSRGLVHAMCGVDMTVWYSDAVSPKRVDEYCRNCFRTMAWEVFEEKMQQLARELGGKEVARV